MKIENLDLEMPQLVHKRSAKDMLNDSTLTLSERTERNTFLIITTLIVKQSEIENKNKNIFVNRNLLMK